MCLSTFGMARVHYGSHMMSHDVTAAKSRSGPDLGGKDEVRTTRYLIITIIGGLGVEEKVIDVTECTPSQRNNPFNRIEKKMWLGDLGLD